MDNTWIKLYRKTLDNGLLKDHSAWAVFSWLLLNVDRKTGKRTVGRFQMSDELGIKPNTLYKILHRLEQKWGVISLSGQKKFTEVCIVNWGKYQLSESSKSNDSQIPVKQQSSTSNTKQEYKNIEIKNIDIFGGDRPENKQLTEKERQKGIKSVKELLKLREEKFITPSITTGIHTDWQERAFREAEELNITLEGSVKGRWLKMYKQASLGRKRANLDKILPYLKDYPKLLTNAEKISYAFWIYEHGINSNPFAN